MGFRPIWPPNADRRVTVRATDEQMVAWGITGRQLSNRSIPEFLAFAADFTVEYFDRMQKKADRAEARQEKKKREQQP